MVVRAGRAYVRPAALVAALAALVVAPSARATAARDPWHLTQVNAPAAHAAGFTGAGVTVALVDSWVDPSHPQLAGRVLPGVDCVSVCRPDAYTADACVHGTHVAGIVAASDYGVAPGAQVLPLRVLAWDEATGECVGKPSDVASALRYAVSRGVDVVNLSVAAGLAGEDNTELVAAVRMAAAAGVVVVFAAGTDTDPVADHYGDDAVIVTATAATGRLASYSQRGPEVDLAAPGGEAAGRSCAAETCVLSTWPGTPDDGERYAAQAGTSMAAPHVSGLAALLLAQRRARTPADVVRVMRTTARPLGAGAGSGLVDVARALGVPAAPVATVAPKLVRPAQQPDGQPATVPPSLRAPEHLAGEPGDGDAAARTAIAVAFVAAAAAGVVVVVATTPRRRRRRHV